MCQFYQRAWKLISKQQQKAHPMQYQASRIDKDGNGYRSESELCRTVWWAVQCRASHGL